MVPVDEAVYDCLKEVRPSVLVVEVVCMLPHIYCEERFDSVCDGGIGVSRFRNFQFAIFQNEPGPPAAKLGNAGILQFFREFFVTAKI